MSLLPDQVTANNFKDFYDKIKPYLNYQPTMGFTPVGTVISIMGTHAPAHYLVCDGTVYNIADHVELANYFKEQFDSYNHFGGDGVTTFAVPDLRGEFLRGSGTNSHENQGSGGDVGEHQDATVNVATPLGVSKSSGTNILMVPINESFISGGSDATYDYYKEANVDKTWGRTRQSIFNANRTDTTSGNWSGQYTSRPTNTSVLYCIAEKNIFIQVLGGGSGTGDMSTADYAKLGVEDTVDKAVNLYDGTNTLSASILELNFVDGVTSPIQTQLNSKSAVSWSQSVTTGTKIATVNIDGTPTDVYAPSGSSGTTDYTDLSNKPQINGNELTGNKTAAQLGIANQTIASGGTDLTARAKVNFTDLDVSDNTANNQTEIKAHELTSAEVTEILSNLPAANTNLMPVLFDEGGSERAVGWYKYADGTKKPVYEKHITLASPRSTAWQQQFLVTCDITSAEYNISDLDQLLGCVVHGETNDNHLSAMFTCGAYLLGNGNIELAMLQTVNVIACTLQYTKTTDTPV